MRRTGSLKFLTRQCGSILLEVMIGVILAGVLLVPLATSFGSAVGQTRDARGRTVAMGEGASGVGDLGGWEWGPRVIAAWWRPGPDLHVRISGGGEDRDDGSRTVGLWVDGWLVEERTIQPMQTRGAEGSDETRVGLGLWNDLTGGELVIRVRGEAGAWGPPWRLSVAEGSAADPAPGSIGTATVALPEAVAHRPAAATSGLQVSWSAAPLRSPAFGEPFVVATDVGGWGSATLDGRTQWWWMEEGRCVDLFF